MPAQKEPVKTGSSDKRIWWVNLGVVLAFSFLAYNFWELQVVQSQAFEDKARENMVRKSSLKADRGLIYGRNGVVLADNRPSADIVFVPGECPVDERAQVCEKLGELLGISAEDLFSSVERQKNTPFTQVLVKRDVSKADRFRVEERSFDLPGVFAVVHPQRRYLQGKVAGQVLGYVNEIAQAELNRERETAEKMGEESRYKMGDLYGRGGVEGYYENELKGTDGYMVVTKYASGMPQMRTSRWGVPYIARRDNLGQTLEPGERQLPIAGNAIYLTLDVGLQAHCEQLLGNEVGAIVVLEAETGAVRALASTPTYDPGVFITGRKEEMDTLFELKEPMLNRGYQELFPPGSIFKIMMASAGLEEGVITEGSTFYCPGLFRLPGVSRPWHCWNRRGHGTVNLVEALAFSCDVFFYNVGLKLGPDRMNQWGNLMGLGIKTGLDVEGEVEGRVPDSAWKAIVNKDKPVWDQNWRDGDTVNVSIGQGDVTTTPLQNAVMMACILNGGRRVRPFLNADLGPQLTEPFLGQHTLDKVIQGMQMCVEKRDRAPTGTGKEAYIEGFTILGKTGTAQVVSLAKHAPYKNEEDIPKELRDHAWFVAGVLSHEPRIAICVLVEHGAHGSSAAAPLAKSVIEYFYAQEQDSELPGAPVQLAQGSP